MKRQTKLLRTLGCCVIMAMLLLSTIMLNPSYALNSGSAFDARAAMGEETVKLLESASREAYVSRDSSGRVTVTEPDAKAFKEVGEISPYIPEGLKVAEPPQTGTKEIIGDDNRVQITDVNAFPFCAIASIEVSYQDGSTAKATASFVSPTALITVGELIYSTLSGWAVEIKIYPGGINSTFDSGKASRVTVFNGWISDSDDNYNFGLIKIADSLNTGHLGVVKHEDEDLDGHVITNYEYPFDKDEGTLWHSAGAVSSVTPSRFLHDADVAYGGEGSPLIMQPQHDKIVGVHGGDADADHNFAFRITQRVLNFITSNTK